MKELKDMTQEELAVELVDELLWVIHGMPTSIEDMLDDRAIEIYQRYIGSYEEIEE